MIKNKRNALLEKSNEESYERLKKVMCFILKSLFINIDYIMNSVMDTVNNVKNTILKLVSHPLFGNSLVKGCMTLLLTFLLFITSMAYLPLLCFLYAFTKTILYSHIVKNDKSVEKVKKSHTELVNNWLVYCLAYSSYTIMNFLLGGLFLIVSRIIMTIFVLDLTFLRNDDSTLSVVLFQIVYRLVKKYREHPLLIKSIDAIDHFENDVYPEKRLGLYNMVMGLISKHFTEDNSDAEISESNTNIETHDDEDELVKSSSNYKISELRSTVVEEEIQNKTIDVDDMDDNINVVVEGAIGNNDAQEESEQAVAQIKKSSKNKHKKKKNKNNGNVKPSSPVQDSNNIEHIPTNELLCNSQIIDEDDDRELDETD